MLSHYSELICKQKATLLCVKFLIIFVVFRPSEGIWVNLKRASEFNPWLWGDCRFQEHNEHGDGWGSTAMTSTTNCAYLDTAGELVPISCNDATPMKPLCREKLLASKESTMFSKVLKLLVYIFSKKMEDVITYLIFISSYAHF